MTKLIRALEFRKNDLAQMRWQDFELAPLKDGEVRLAIGTTAFTANNVTYGLIGDKFGYWEFFPASEQGWGIIPVWGFAQVTESLVADIKVGERIYGYFPTASHLTVTPAKITPENFLDGSQHRRPLPVIYNLYDCLAADPTYTAESEAYRSLFIPLAATAYGLSDWLQQTNYQDAEVVLCVSASSKTALSTAMMLRSAGTDRKIVGLTSLRNRDVVEKLGVYDQVLTYDDIPGLDTSRPHVMIDFAGNGEVSAKIHQHLGDNMRHNAGVGASHAEAVRVAPGMNADRTKLFFMPSYAAERMKETDGQFREDMRGAAARVTKEAANWMRLDIATNRSSVEALVKKVREGQIAPDQGGIICFDRFEN